MTTLSLFWLALTVLLMGSASADDYRYGRATFYDDNNQVSRTRNTHDTAAFTAAAADPSHRLLDCPSKDRLEFQGTRASLVDLEGLAEQAN